MDAPAVTFGIDRFACLSHDPGHDTREAQENPIAAARMAVIASQSTISCFATDGLRSMLSRVMQAHRC
jgi:hypothetical protein